MTVTMAPGASSDCTKAYPIDSDAPTTSPSHGNANSVHGESPRPIPEKRLCFESPACTSPFRIRGAGTYTGRTGGVRGPTFQFTVVTLRVKGCEST